MRAAKQAAVINEISLGPGAMIAGVIAFYASARSLQIGEGVEAIALTSAVRSANGAVRPS